MRILIVDDEEDFVGMLKERLCRYDRDVDTAYDGRQAIDLIKTNAYDVVLLDHNMPELTGLEVIKRMKEMESTSKIIMITAYEEMDEFFAKSIGADAYLTKPVKLDDVERLVTSLCPDEG